MHCCRVPSSIKCLPKDRISSCDKLIDNDILRVAIWGTGTLSLAANLFATGRNMFMLHQNHIITLKDILELQIGFSNMLMSIYPLTVSFLGSLQQVNLVITI